MTQRGYFSWCDASTHFKPLAKSTARSRRSGRHARAPPPTLESAQISLSTSPTISGFIVRPSSPSSSNSRMKAWKTIHNLRFAIVRKAVTDRGKIVRTFQKRSLEPFRTARTSGSIFESRKIQPHRVERFSQVRASTPIALPCDADTPPNRRERPARAPSLRCRFDRRNRRSSRRWPRRRSTSHCQSSSVSWLQAVAKLRILPCNSIGQRMKVRLSHNDGAACAKLLHEP